MEKKNVVIKKAFISFTAIFLFAVVCIMHTAASTQWVIREIECNFIKQDGTWGGLTFSWGSEEEYQNQDYQTISGLRTSGTQYMTSMVFLDTVFLPDTIFSITYVYKLSELWTDPQYAMSINDVFLVDEYAVSTFSVADTEGVYWDTIEFDDCVYLMIVIDTRVDAIKEAFLNGYSYGFGYASSFPALSSGSLSYKILSCEALETPDVDVGDDDDSGTGEYPPIIDPDYPDIGGGTGYDSVVQEAIDRQTALIRDDISNMKNEISNDLSDLNNSVQEGSKDVVDAIQNQNKEEKEEANTSGNKFIEEALSAVDIMPADDISSALGNLVSLLAYDGTDCVFSLPRCQIPLTLKGSSVNINLWEEQRINFNEIILNHSIMTTYVYPITKFLFSLGAMYYFWNEIASLITDDMENLSRVRGGKGSKTG